MTFLHLDDLRIGEGDALIVVDLQNDFLPGGSLAVPGADEILPVLGRAIGRFSAVGLPIFATRCWHPPSHCSFREQGGPWPPHCVQGTVGAALALGLVSRSVGIVSKATTPEEDAFSGFERTDLKQRLRSAGAHHLFIGGLATEHCVFTTVKDAFAYGFGVSLLVDGIRPIDAAAGLRAVAEMKHLGAVCLEVGSHRPEMYAP